MKNTYLDELVKVLQGDERLVNSDGKLLKSKTTELARGLDEKLVSLMLNNSKLKSFFFKKIGDALVFDQEKFLTFVHNEAFFEDSYTAYKKKIGLATGKDDYISERSEVVLNWPYKDCVLEGGQDKEDQKRDEVFWNEVLEADQRDSLLAPKVLTGFKRYDKYGEHDVKELSGNDNFIIRGNNLLALHTLKKRYAGKVKLIYIDPPFYFSDTKSEDSFKYNSNFKLSTWLTFMKNRLEIARDLLSDDGLIFVHVGVEDSSYLNILLDEMFKHDNFVNHITMTTNDPSGFKATGAKIFSTSNHLFIYKKPLASLKKLYTRKGYDSAYKYVILNKDRPFSEWKFTTIKKHLSSLRSEPERNIQRQTIEDFANNYPELVFRTAAIGGGARKKRLSTIERSKETRGEVMEHPGDDLEDFYILNGEGIVFWSDIHKEVDGEKVPAAALTDVWSDISWTGIAPEGGVTLKNGKKPEKLLKRIVELATKESDLVLDYHAGSGTTAAVAHKMNRRYIGIEQLLYGENDPTVRLKRVINGDQTGISKSVDWQGGGSFVYAHLKNDVNQFIKEVEKAKDKKSVEDLLQTVLTSNFLSHRVDPKKFEQDEFAKFDLKEQKRLLIDLVNKNKLYVNYHDIDDASYKVDENTKQLNHWMQKRD